VNRLKPVGSPIMTHLNPDQVAEAIRQFQEIESALPHVKIVSFRNLIYKP
jgi:hypothetical protein